jgi:tetratricopeptide (TPR) repeat protein
LIDFAIFEPGVLTTFWAIVAAFIAAATLRNCNQQFAVKPTAFTRIAVMAAGVLITWAYFKYCLIPVAKSTTEIKQAYQANRNGNSEEAYSILAAAVKQDHLSPVISSLAGRLYLQNFYNSSLKNKELLLRSEQYFLNAIHRNTANFRNFELLSEVYTSLAELSKGQAKTDWLNKTFNSSSMAVERYPGSAKLRIRLARIAEQLGEIDLAVQQYKKTIEVEDSFRLQFRIVYPDRKIVSRLGEEEYNFAKQRIKLLCP